MRRAIATNTAGIATNTTSIATNTSGVATNAAAISTVSTGVTTNTAGIATNVTNITANTSGVSTNAAGITSNVSAISLNTTGIAANNTAILLNTAGVNTNKTAITANLGFILGNTAAINELREGTAALASIPDLYLQANETWTAAGGLAGYDDGYGGVEYGFGGGAQFRIGDKYNHTSVGIAASTFRQHIHGPCSAKDRRLGNKSNDSTRDGLHRDCRPKDRLRTENR